MSRRHVLLPSSLSSLLIRLEELVLANSGEDEFEEIFKLLVAKLWSERIGCDGFARHDSEQQTFAAVSALLDAACHAWDGLFAAGEGFRLSPEHLAACVEVLAGHQLLAAGGEALDAAFEFLNSRAAKGAKGQFFTPRHVVDLCVRMIRPGRTETVLDPACGSGAFLLHALACQPGSTAERLWGFDFDSRAIRIASALLQVSGSPGAHLHRLNSLIKPPAGHAAGVETIEYTLRAGGGPSHGFDVILTNPPFAGEVRERALLDRYSLGAGRSRLERDVLFLERCLELLRPGGRLCMVLPHNKFGAQSFASLRGWLVERLQVVAVIGLGRNTFMPHTSQKASVLFGTRRPAGAHLSTEEPVFFGISEREGKDRRGTPVFSAPLPRGSSPSWRDLDHDLGDLLRAFKAHLDATGIPWAEA